MPMSASTTSASDDTATVIAIGVLAATLAAVCHETLGHGLGCVGAGGHIVLLTSIWFSCSKGAAITDAGGPLGNLLAGSLALVFLGHGRPSPTHRLLLVLFGALNLFWFMGQLVFESLTQSHSDWYWAVQRGWPAVGRPVGSIAGVCGYLLVGRWVSAVIRKNGGLQTHAIRLAYAGAAASAGIAGLMWRPEPLRSALEGFLTLGVAQLGLLRVARSAGGDVGHDVSAGFVPRSWIWIAVCAAIFSIFLVVQARGLGSMAAVRLPE
jgi:hypothetical protein